MKPGVVNVLIAYVLKVNNNKFTRNYVEAVAAQWCRMNIETVEDAMRVAEKEHKKIKKAIEIKNIKTSTSKKIPEEEQLPEWFNEKTNKEFTEKDKDEFQNILDSIS
jgi:replication initiation and membrane attachment protein